MRVAITVEFLEAFRRLPRTVQKKAREFIEKFQANPTSPGINYEKIHGARDPMVRTVRIDKTYRGVVLHPAKGDLYRLVWLDHHDAAIEWCKVRLFEANPLTDAVEVINIAEVESKVGAQAERHADTSAPLTCATPLFSAFSDNMLTSAGIPHVLLPAIRAIVSSEMLRELRGPITGHLIEALEFLLAGQSLSDVAQYVQDCESGRQTQSIDFQGGRQPVRVEPLSTQHNLLELLDRLMSQPSEAGSSEPSGESKAAHTANSELTPIDEASDNGADEGGQPPDVAAEGSDENDEELERRVRAYTEAIIRLLSPRENHHVPLTATAQPTVQRGRRLERVEAANEQQEPKVGKAVDLLAALMRPREKFPSTRIVAVLYGEGGAGKTTTIEQLTLRLARQYQPRGRVFIRGVLINWRSDATDVWAFLADQCATTLPGRSVQLCEDDLKSLARSGRLGVILDGADEHLPGRARLIDVIETLAEWRDVNSAGRRSSFEIRVPIVVGSRRNAEELRAISTMDVSLQAMDQSTVEEFLCTQLGTDRGRELFRVVDASPETRDLLSIPICSHMLCGLTSDSNLRLSSLPTTASELFRQFFNEFYLREGMGGALYREGKRRVDVLPERRLDVARQAVSQLAFKLLRDTQKQGCLVIDLTRQLGELGFRDPGEATDRLLEMPLFRRIDSGRSFKFVHANHRDYLAAEHLLNHPTAIRDVPAAALQDVPALIAGVFELAGPDLYPESEQNSKPLDQHFCELVAALWKADPLLVTLAVRSPHVLKHVIIDPDLNAWVRGVLRVARESGSNPIEVPETAEICDTVDSEPPQRLLSRLRDPLLWQTAFSHGQGRARLEALWTLLTSSPEPWADLLPACFEGCPAWARKLLAEATTDGPTRECMEVLAIMLGLRPGVHPDQRLDTDKLLEWWDDEEGELFPDPPPDAVRDTSLPSCWLPSVILKVPPALALGCFLKSFHHPVEYARWLLAQHAWDAFDIITTRRQWATLWEHWDCLDPGLTPQPSYNTTWPVAPPQNSPPVPRLTTLVPDTFSRNTACAIVRFGWAAPHSFLRDVRNTWMQSASQIEAEAMQLSGLFDWRDLPDAKRAQFVKAARARDVHGLEVMLPKSHLLLWDDLPALTQDRFLGHALSKDLVISWLHQKRLSWTQLSSKHRLWLADAAGNHLLFLELARRLEPDREPYALVPALSHPYAVGTAICDAVRSDQIPLGGLSDEEIACLGWTFIVSHIDEFFRLGGSREAVFEGVDSNWEIHLPACARLQMLHAGAIQWDQVSPLFVSCLLEPPACFAWDTFQWFDILVRIGATTWARFSGSRDRWIGECHHRPALAVRMLASGAISPSDFTPSMRKDLISATEASADMDSLGELVDLRAVSWEDTPPHILIRYITEMHSRDKGTATEALIGGAIAGLRARQNTILTECDEELSALNMCLLVDLAIVNPEDCDDTLRQRWLHEVEECHRFSGAAERTKALLSRSLLRAEDASGVWNRLLTKAAPIAAEEVTLEDIFPIGEIIAAMEMINLGVVSEIDLPVRWARTVAERIDLRGFIQAGIAKWGSPAFLAQLDRHLRPRLAYVLIVTQLRRPEDFFGRFDNRQPLDAYHSKEQNAIYIAAAGISADLRRHLDHFSEERRADALASEALELVTHHHVRGEDIPPALYRHLEEWVSPKILLRLAEVGWVRSDDLTSQRVSVLAATCGFTELALLVHSRMLRLEDISDARLRNSVAVLSGTDCVLLRLNEIDASQVPLRSDDVEELVKRVPRIRRLLEQAGLWPPTQVNPDTIISSLTSEQRSQLGCNSIELGRTLAGGLSGSAVVRVYYQDSGFGEPRVGVLKLTSKLQDYERELDGARRAKSSWLATLHWVCPLAGHLGPPALPVSVMLFPLAFSPTRQSLDVASLHELISNRHDAAALQGAKDAAVELGRGYALHATVQDTVHHSFEQLCRLVRHWPKVNDHLGLFKDYEIADPAASEIRLGDRIVTNPLWCIAQRNAWKDEKIRVPVGFVHGDLNVRNVLVRGHSESQGSPGADKPLLQLIDFEKAADAQPPVLDLSWAANWMVMASSGKRALDDQPYVDELPLALVHAVLQPEERSPFGSLGEFDTGLDLARRMFLSYREVVMQKVRTPDGRGSVENIWHVASALSLGVAGMAKAGYELGDLAKSAGNPRDSVKNTARRYWATVFFRVAAWAFEESRLLRSM